jgi:MFS family permease
VGFGELWRAPRFRLLLGVRVSGAVAIGMVQAALATYVLFSPERAATPAKVAITFVVLLLPYSLIGPFVGVLLDRLWRRQVLVVSDLLQALLTAVLVALAHARHDGPDLALTVLALLAANRFVLAAISSGTPHVVPERYLVTANAVAPTVGTAASVVGGLAGIVLREALGGDDRGSVVVLAVAAVACGVTSAIAARFRRAELGPSADEGRDSLRAVVSGLASGVRALLARPRATRAMGLITVQRATFGIAVALAVLQSRGSLHPPQAVDAALRDVALATGFAGAGALVGALVTPAVAHRIGARRWSTGAVSVGTVAGALALSTVSLPGLLVAGFCVGAGGQGAKVCTDTIVQAEIDDDHRGRVFALYDMAVNVAIVVGVTFTVAVAPVDGRSWLAVVVMAVAALTASAYVYLRGRGDDSPLPAAERLIA